MRLRTPKDKVPVSFFEASRQLTLREAAAQQRRVSSLLGNITRKVVDYPACPQSVMSIEDFRLQTTRSTPNYRTAPIRVANMKDGVGIVLQSETFLEDRLHMLTLPSIGEAEYSRWAVNVDSQAMPSDTIDVAGIEQIAANSGVFLALNYCMGALVVEASYGWKNALK